MRNYTLKPWVLAVSMALLTPCVASAAGLGRLAVLSGLGQPLNAEIELLSVQKGESVVARLASVDTYQQANLQYNPALVGARVTVEKRPNGQAYLKAITPRPINEPFVEFVVELNSEHGRVTRQYTILLDPPGYGRGTAEVPAPPVAAPTPRAPATQAQEPAASAAPAAVAPAPAVLSAPQPSASQSSPADTRPAPAPGGAPALQSPPRPAPAPAAVATPASQYGPVKPGETLTRIARSVKPEGVSLEQTLVGLYRHNPDAFIKKNMNLVKSGKILRVPEATELATVTQSEAVKEIHVQVADFNVLRGKLADGAGAAREEGSVASGRIGARVAEPGATEPRDTVRLSKGEPPSGKAARTGSSGDRVRALEEEAVAREKALSEANERIAQLERTIKDMQRLAELKGSGAAAVQQKPAEKSALAPQSAPAVKSPLPTAAVVAQPPAKEAEAPSVIARDAAKSAALDAAKAAPAAASKSAAGVDVAKTSPAQPKDAPAAQAAKAKPAAAMPPPPEPATDFLEMVMNEPLYLAAGGAAVVLGGLGLVMARRRRNPDNVIKEDDDLIKIPPILASAPAAAMATTETASKASVPATGSQPSPALPAAPGSAEGARPGASKGRETSTGHRPAGEDNDLSFNPETDTPAVSQSPASSLDSFTASRQDPDDLKTAELSAPELKVAQEPQRGEQAAAPPLIPDFGLETPTARPSAHDLRVAQEQNAEDTPAEPMVRDFGLDIPASSSIPPAPLPSASVNEGPNSRELDVVDFNLDPLPAIDASADTILSERAPLVSEAPLEDFKLDDLDLSFGAEPVARGGVKDDHWYDVQQKFDLAKAYEEMGDKEGARDILQEVVKEGDSEQQAQANKLLGSLG